MNALRVVMLAPFGLSPKGTVSARMMPLAEGLARRGHAVALIIPPWDAPQDSGRTWEEGGVQVHNLRVDDLRRPRLSPTLIHRTVQAVREQNPHLVHVFKPIGQAGAAAWFLSHHAGRPALLADVDDLEGRRGWGGRRPIPAWEGWVRQMQMRWAVGHADGITVASRYALEFCRRGARRETGLLYLPNGCRAEGPLPASPAWEQARRAARTALGIGEGSSAVLWSTRFHEIHPDRAGPILQGILAACPGADIYVAGAGLTQPDRRREGRLRELLAPSGRAHFVGWLPRPEWERLVLASDLGILPMDETPINQARCPATLPAMLCAGLPVAAHAVGEASTYIRDGHSGWLVPAGEVEGFVQAVRGALSAPGRLQAMREEAARTTGENWSWEVLAGRLESHYFQILERPHFAKS